MPDFPSGTVIFLFTDIEGSTALWERDRQAMAVAVDRHIALLGDAVRAHGGVHFKTVGDAVQAAFPVARNALAAAVAAQRALRAEPWSDPPGPPRVRMALHAGEAHPQDGDYLAAPLNRLSRLLSAGHGDQVLLTQAVQQLARDDLPADVTLKPLGAHRLRDLQEPEVVFQVMAPGLPDTFPPPRALPSHPTNLIEPPTSLIGRDAEVSAVLRLFDNGARLVTLTGPGGTGKTRLAQEIAAEALQRYPDGVFFVDLAPVRDPGYVLASLASVLGVREVGGEPLGTTLQRYLADRQTLLVLDNCEQILAAAPDLAALVSDCPRLTLLATSRESLRLRAEKVFPVPPLPLPDVQHRPGLPELAQIPSVALFVERARAADPAFTLTAGNADAVAAICRRLDGLPLALELAAARVRHLPPPALLARLERRLPVLTGGPRDAPERQRTLRQAIAWSYDLLEPAEQTLFRCLAVFVGGWTLDAAEAVANRDGSLDVLEGLASLADKSLVLLDAGAAEPRYQMLETIREFAADQLTASADEELVRQAHVTYLDGLSRENDLFDLAAELPSAFEGRLARLGSEEANFRAALEWAIAHDPATAIAIAARLGPYWFAESRSATGLDVLMRALAPVAGETAPERARALGEAANLAIALGEFARAEELADAAFTLAQRRGELPSAAVARYCQGYIAMIRGDGERAESLLQEALTHFETLGYESSVHVCLNDLGLNAIQQGDAASAISFFERCLAFEELRSDPSSRAVYLQNLAEAHRYLGHHELAWDLAAQAHVLAQEVRSSYLKAAALGILGLLALDRREIPLAAAHVHECLDLWWEIGDKWNLARGLESAAMTVVAADRPAAATRLYGVAEALREAIASPMGVLDHIEYERDLRVLRAGLDEPTFTREWEQGRRRPLARAVADATEVLAAIAGPPAGDNAAAPSMANRDTTRV